MAPIAGTIQPATSMKKPLHIATNTTSQIDGANQNRDRRQDVELIEHQRKRREPQHRRKQQPVNPNSCPHPLSQTHRPRSRRRDHFVQAIRILLAALDPHANPDQRTDSQKTKLRPALNKSFGLIAITTSAAAKIELNPTPRLPDQAATHINTLNTAARTTGGCASASSAYRDNLSQTDHP